jgi:hypothetical protein
MNAAKKTLARTQKFVADHKVAIAVVTTAAATSAVWFKTTAGAVRQFNEFLDEKGLLEEFHATFDEIV